MDSENESSTSLEDEAEVIDPLISASSKGKRRRSRRTDDQFKLLKMNVPSSSLSSVDQTLAWEMLTKQLNELGPPRHNTSGWRKLWTSHKAKAKRRMTTSDYENEYLLPCEGVKQKDVYINDPEALIVNDPTISEPSTCELPVLICDDETKRTILDMSTKIDKVLKQQSVLFDGEKDQKTLIEQQKALIDQQKTLIEQQNTLIENLSKSLQPN